MDAADLPKLSYEGLYYSTDSGVTWSLARITDLNGQDVQGPIDATRSDGNAATSVVWNPVREAVYGGGALSRLLPVDRRRQVDAAGVAARYRPDHRVCAPPIRPWSARPPAPSIAEPWP